MDVSRGQVKAFFKHYCQVALQSDRFDYSQMPCALPAGSKDSDRALLFVVTGCFAQGVTIGDWDEAEKKFVKICEDTELYRKMLRLTMAVRVIFAVAIGASTGERLGPDEHAFSIQTLKAVDDRACRWTKYALQTDSEAEAGRCDGKRLEVLIRLAMKDFSDTWKEVWATTDITPEECCCCLDEPVTIMFSSCGHACICSSCRTRLIVRHHGQTEKRRYNSAVIPCPLCRTEGPTVQI